MSEVQSMIIRTQREIALKKAELRQLKVKLTFLKEKLNESRRANR